MSEFFAGSGQRRIFVGKKTGLTSASARAVRFSRPTAMSAQPKRIGFAQRVVASKNFDARLKLKSKPATSSSSSTPTVVDARAKITHKQSGDARQSILLKKRQNEAIRNLALTERRRSLIKQHLQPASSQIVVETNQHRATYNRSLGDLQAAGLASTNQSQTRVVVGVARPQERMGGSTLPAGDMRIQIQRMKGALGTQTSRSPVKRPISPITFSGDRARLGNEGLSNVGPTRNGEGGNGGGSGGGESGGGARAIVTLKRGSIQKVFSVPRPQQQEQPEMKKKSLTQVLPPRQSTSSSAAATAAALTSRQHRPRSDGVHESAKSRLGNAVRRLSGETERSSQALPPSHRSALMHSTPGVKTASRKEIVPRVRSSSSSSASSSSSSRRSDDNREQYKVKEEEEMRTSRHPFGTQIHKGANVAQPQRRQAVKPAARSSSGGAGGKVASRRRSPSPEMIDEGRSGDESTGEEWRRERSDTSDDDEASYQPPPKRVTHSVQETSSSSALLSNRTSSSGSAVVAQGSSVRISNLDRNVTHEDIIELFGAVGPLKKVIMKKGGVAEVTFADAPAAKRAIKKYDTRELDGLPMSVVLMPDPVLPVSSPYSTSFLDNDESAGGGTLKPLISKAKAAAGASAQPSNTVAATITEHQPLRFNTEPVKNPIDLDLAILHRALFKSSSSSSSEQHSSKPVSFTVHM